MTTIRDVARAAGVSTATVSHVINSTRFVSDEVVTDVQRAMEALGYHPNVLARGLRSGHTRTIGLLLPDNSNLFFAEVSRIIEDVSFKNGYSLIICNTDANLVKEKSYLETLVAKRVDGILFISVGGSALNIQGVTQEKIPIVIVDREIEGLDADTVLADNQLGGYLATRYLVQLGHRRIACISGPSEMAPSQQRLVGYRKALEEAGIAFEDNLIVRGDFRYQSGERGMRTLMQVDPRPTAVFVCNDMMALGVIKAAHNLAIKIPEEFSVVGFDDIPLTEAVSPSLTSVSQPYTEMATAATELLLKRLAGLKRKGTIKECERIVFKPTLTVRESCASPREV
jgi:LacI family transcriptional regulator